MTNNKDTQRIQIISDFLSTYFGDDLDGASLIESEDVLIASIIDYVNSRFNRMRYILGLAIDFTLLAQRLSSEDSEAKSYRPNISLSTILERYNLVKERGETKANTLTLGYGGQKFGIRQTEESLGPLFNKLGRNYPSSYVYNTGQWHKYTDLLETCFKLSEVGRYEACRRMIAFGLEKLTENRFFGREVPRIHLLPIILERYDRRPKRTENGGLVFQALVFGYLSADRPHLDLVVDKVRTGSSRQHRFGDVDGYFGLDLELSAEVKDIHITAQNVVSELGNFMTRVTGSGINGIVFARSFDNEAIEQLSNARVLPLAQSQMLSVVALWDWQKQDRAVQGTLHYLAHIEHNPDATNRLLKFIEEYDQNHSSQAYSSSNLTIMSEIRSDSSQSDGE